MEPAPKKRKITSRVVEALAPGDLVMDAEVAGFGVRRQEDARVYFVRKYARGRRHFETIGEHGTGGLTPTTARKKAHQIVAALRDGYSPTERRAREKVIPTVAELSDLFLRDHVVSKRKRTTAANYANIIELHIKPTLGRLKVDAVTTAHVGRLHGALGSTRYQANRVLAVLSKMFSWAIQQGFRGRGTNPCQGVERFKEDRRERFLSQAELARLGETLADAEAPDSGGSESPKPWLRSVYSF